MTSLLAGLWALFIVFLVACKGGTPLRGGHDSSGPVQPQRFEFTRLEMGVKTRIVTHAPSQELAQAGAQAAFARIAALDACMSDYRAESELSRLCVHAPGEAVPVSADLLTVLLTAQHVSEVSGGAFDVTVGPLVSLWRQARRLGALPTEGVLVVARKSVGWQNLELDAARRTATLRKPGMTLDLGGIAKGYAAQQALETLRARGLPQSLVALSGDIAAGDPPPGERGWKIEVAPPPAESHPTSDIPHPTSHTTSPVHVHLRTLLLANACVSTSGDAEQFVEIGGKRYAHIIDPRTGMATTGGVQATVVGRRGDVVDAAATALCVLGLRENADLSAELGVSSIVTGVENGMVIEWISDDAGLLKWAADR
jgi:thiamine biosynthesis lipoprotein